MAMADYVAGNHRWVMARRFYHRLFSLSGLLAIAFGLIACPSNSNSTIETSVRSAHSSWVEESFQTEVVNIGLAQLGYPIETPETLDYAAIYLSLANQDLDYSVVSYDAGHESLYDQANRNNELEKLGQVVPPGSQGYHMDKKTVDEYGISSIEQLKDPQLANLFDTDGNGKANLVGCNPGWVCESVINHHLKVYGLEDTVEQDQGNYTSLLVDTIAHYQEGKPILYYAYNPHWIFAVLKVNQDVMALEVPFTSVPEDMVGIEEADTMFEGNNLGWPAIGQSFVVNRQFISRNPKAQRWLELVSIPVADMNEVSWQIKEGADTPDDIRRLAREWVSENQVQFDAWLAQARGEN